MSVVVLSQALVLWKQDCADDCRNLYVRPALLEHNETDFSIDTLPYADMSRNSHQKSCPLGFPDRQNVL